MSHADEFAFVVSDRTPRAIKDHECYACHETISPGHRYRRWVLVGDDTAETIKHCLRCYEIWRAIANASPNEPIDWSLDCGETWDHVFGECPPEVEALAFALPDEMQAPS